MEDYKGNWNYYGECDKNNVPWGIGRLISKYESMFIDCYFKKGQCHGLLRSICDDGTFF